ncbi:hypothetical protein PJP10_32005, partial [Mycobacterium kansasii]
AQLQLVERDDLEDEEDCFESIDKREKISSHFLQFQFHFISFPLHPENTLLEWRSPALISLHFTAA